MSKNKIILIGAGGHARSCIDVIEKEGKWEIAGLIDAPEKLNQQILGYRIIGTDNDISSFHSKGFAFLITVGQIKSAMVRKRIFESLLALNAELPVIISPLAHVSPHAIIQSGTIVMHMACVNAGAVIGHNCIINTKALIEHDVQIGDHCHISTGAILNGGVVAGDEIFFGSGAVSREGVSIPTASFIKANSTYKGA